MRPPFYDSIEEYDMENHRGRKPKYLTIKRFDHFLNNDFYHLTRDVSWNKWTLRVILGAIIAWAVVERLT